MSTPKTPVSGVAGGTRTYQQSFSVDYSYDVHFTRDAFEPENRLLVETLEDPERARQARVFVCVDEGVILAQPELTARVGEYFRRHSARLDLVAPPRVVPGGETAKTNWRCVEELVATLGALHLDRQSYVVVIGGGSVLDMVGLVTALVHRGLRLVRMPTTVLAQNDAGVGVKNGMNALGAKNFIGTFAPPWAVIDDFVFLRTLPDAHWVGGIAEALKVAIIKDARFFEFLCERATLLRARDEPAMEQLVRRCATLHLEHIANGGDPFELGSARPLDFGHWSAHKLESLSEYRIGHGQAVAAGIALDSLYARRAGLLAAPELESILTALRESGLPLWYPEMEGRDEAGSLALLAGLEEFREHLGGELTITLPRGIGRKVELHSLHSRWIEEGVAELHRRAFA